MDPMKPSVDRTEDIEQAIPSHGESLTRTETFLFTGIPAILIAGLVVWLAYQINWAFVSSLDFAVLWKYRVALLSGLLNTLLITFASIALGTVIGFLLTISLMQRTRFLRWPVLAFLEIMRNVPIVVVLFWVHFALPVLTGFSTSVFQSGVIAMTVQSSAYLTDVIRAGIQAVPKGQWQAADALGLATASKWIDIILPQAAKIVIPPLANVSIGYFKASATLALLSVGELMTVASRVSTYSYKPIETMTAVGAIYLAMGYVLSHLTYRLERVLGGRRI
jgi:His/Glu/Gln/Arg/opine family amino acid ABC transporter permease subunit